MTTKCVNRHQTQSEKYEKRQQKRYKPVKRRVDVLWHWDSHVCSAVEKVRARDAVTAVGVTETPRDLRMDTLCCGQTRSLTPEQHKAVYYHHTIGHTVAPLWEFQQAAARLKTLASGKQRNFPFGYVQTQEFPLITFRERDKETNISRTIVNLLQFVN